MENAATTFDHASVEYEQQLAQGISLSGESSDYFVRGRIAALRHAVQAQPTRVRSVLDFGCGVGNAAVPLLDGTGADRVVGLDCSAESIRIAKNKYRDENFQWLTDGDSIPPESIDLGYTSGVFHHIDPSQRQENLRRIFGWLKPGGLFAFFENNPWNPATHWVMSRIPFDRDAVCLSPIEARRRLRDVGFRIVKTRTLFFFPRMLAALRPVERVLQYTPAGAQYLVLAERV